MKRFESAQKDESSSHMSPGLMNTVYTTVSITYIPDLLRAYLLPGHLIRRSQII
jgi:hypothetical protein